MKLILGQEQINFLGHTISKEEVKLDASNVEVIRKIPLGVKGIWKVLGTQLLQMICPGNGRISLTP